MKTLTSILFCCFFIQITIAQVYIEKQTRHRFAQMNMGLDIQTNFGGKTTFINQAGNLESLDFPSSYTPRFIIGGTHFWGHADFYVTIPLFSPTMKDQNQDIFFTSGAETVFKYYPWRIEHKKFRPFIGLSLSSYFFSQDNNNFEFKNGPQTNTTRIPLLGGFTFNHKNHLIELSCTYNYSNKVEYYVSRTQAANVEIPPLFATLSYRFMLDTTVGAEKDWESGRTDLITEKLAEKGALNIFFIGAGMSSAWWLGESDFNQSERPYIQNYGTNVMPDFTAGYYIHQPDLNISANYRGYKYAAETYGTTQIAQRKSFGLEITKNLGDYHGFVPFLGPIVSYEKLSFTEQVENNTPFFKEDNQFSYGLTFGWDIRPNRIQSFILRTNLRYFPDLSLNVVDDLSINFNNIEFNFIQLIIYPSRMF